MLHPPPVDDCDGIDIPTDVDVLLGRGAGCWNHPGNRKFRDIVHKHLCSYDNAKLRVEKTHIVSIILREVLESGGRFLKRNHVTEKWDIVDQRVANEKIGHAIRDKRATTRTDVESSNEEKETQEEETGADLPAFFQKRRQDHQDALNRMSMDMEGSFPFSPPINRLIPPHLREGNAFADALRFNSTHPALRRQLPLAGLRLVNRVPPAPQVARPSPFFTPAKPLPTPNLGVEQHLKNRHKALLEQSSTYLQNASEALRNLQSTQQAMEVIAAQKQQEEQQQRHLIEVIAAQKQQEEQQQRQLMEVIAAQRQQDQQQQQRQRQQFQKLAAAQSAVMKCVAMLLLPWLSPP